MIQIHAPYIPSTRFNDRVPGLEEGDTQHRQHNYELCQAIDLTKLGIILEKMVNDGKLHPQMATIYKIQGNALLAALLSENNRLHNL